VLNQQQSRNGSSNPWHCIASSLRCNLANILFVLCEKLRALHMNLLVTRTDCGSSSRISFSEHRSFWWLRELPVVEACHLSTCIVLVSGGRGSHAGVTDLRISTSRVSRVCLRFHSARIGSLLRSTFPSTWETNERFTRDENWTVGGCSG